MSITNITYFHDLFESDNICIVNYPDIYLFNFSEISEWKSFLKSLEIGKLYVVSLELVLDMDLYNYEDPTIVLSKPILITRDSDPILLAGYAISVEVRAGFMYDLHINYKSAIKRPMIIAKYKEIIL